ncbi:unnamed protein product, partial [Anisakis simplex]|uniref:Splicing factor 3A subunit 1 (inferred by orthology to a human protein) n=1 Tax=Anisakis simplex TaxID=6269 RepID=A0A0M3J764_ANISI
STAPLTTIPPPTSNTTASTAPAPPTSTSNAPSSTAPPTPKSTIVTITVPPIRPPQSTAPTIVQSATGAPMQVPSIASLRTALPPGFPPIPFPTGAPAVPMPPMPRPMGLPTLRYVRVMCWILEMVSKTLGYCDEDMPPVAVPIIPVPVIPQPPMSTVPVNVPLPSTPATIPQPLNANIVPPLPTGGAPSQQQSDGAPPAKRARTEDDLESEADWLAKVSGSITINVQTPTNSSNPDWKLDGKNLSVSLDVAAPVSSLKSAIQDQTGLPGSKQKLTFDVC